MYPIELLHACEKLSGGIGVFLVADPGFPVGGGADLRRGRFLAKICAKTKELDPVGGGGGRRRCTPWIHQCLS